MLPPITGPGTFSPAPLAPAVSARAEQGAQPTTGETAAAAVRPETPERVDPPRTLPATARLPEERRRETLYPPDPDPPTGPPPAFEATPLEQARKNALAAESLIAEREAQASAAPPATAAAAAGETRRPDQTPDLLARTEAEVAEVRRMAEPEPERTLDVTR
jgi:hypothetical protein